MEPPHPLVLSFSNLGYNERLWLQKLKSNRAEEERGEPSRVPTLISLNYKLQMDRHAPFFPLGIGIISAESEGATIYALR